ncbi:MAG: ABC transporter permease [Asticcacaulis sp.]
MPVSDSSRPNPAPPAQNSRKAAVRIWQAVARAHATTPILLLLIWEVCARTGLIPARILAAPSTVAGTLFEMILSGELPSNLLVSLGRAALGLGIGAGLGIVLGLIAGLSRQGEASIDPLMQIKRTIPVLALTPLFIVWFGIGEASKLALIAFATVFPVYLNLYGGIRQVDPRLLDMARSFGLSRFEIIRKVVLPAALPSLLIGLRYALSISILVLVVAEQINATAGLGYLVNNARDFMRTDIIVVCLMVYAVLGLLAEQLVKFIERQALVWRPESVARA